MANHYTLKRRRSRVRAAERRLRRASGKPLGPSFGLDALNSILEQTYLPAIRQLFEQRSVLMDYFQKEHVDLSGSYYVTVPFSMRPRV